MAVLDADDDAPRRRSQSVHHAIEIAMPSVR
jgi:hypothetical protein